MEATRFDAWTRRRLGLAAGGMFATLGRWGLADDTAAGKKRCKKLGQGCKQGGKRKCCGTLKCDATGVDGELPTACCKRAGKPCSEVRDCCDGLGCCGLIGETVCSEICFSDRNLKTNFGTVDPADMLQRVKELPIATWNYTSDDPTVRHIGPMAQDFAATFGVGADDRHIHPIDGQGIALAAIQGLIAELEQLRADNTALAARIADLERSRQAGKPAGTGGEAIADS